ncbi:type I-C CRISPR-associated endonuclease Cas1c [Akkermansia sp. N21116]|jgi:CRISPR-associated protein Cas1|uniref:type I-C CRISPR-associated endonuclease Cas1c n=1 Tax=Akkermansia sp. N21116 TaxID=3040764 RepID=UPI00244E6D41|nr:type I-C CRISPR-associated endonuclease Cas1c [Akkermansia sp. N21116]WPX39927.1 type I-C CRISPR-associated endonuclease Cas1c [Akkermansia sp. N21116]
MKQHLNTLFVTREGVWLAKDGETVSIQEKGNTLMRVPLHNLESIMTMGWDIAVSPQLMAACVEQGISLSFCSPHGRFFASATGATRGNVLLRRTQYRWADDAERGLHIAREMITAKVLNCRNVLMRASRDHPDAQSALQPAIDGLAASIRQIRKVDAAASLLGFEGQAADIYFSAFPHMISNSHRAFVFSGRNRRPPRDAVNAVLSFLYSLLAHDCRSALEACGLDSFVGFFHRDRPGRAGLALDLMEEFRAPLADRMALSLINRQQLDMKDFEYEASGAVLLREESRKKVITAWQERKKEQIIHPFLQEKMTIGFLPHIQARLLSRHLRGDIDSYPPMIWK